MVNKIPQEFYKSILGEVSDTGSLPERYDEAFKLFSRISVNSETVAELFTMTRKTLLSYRKSQRFLSDPHRVMMLFFLRHLIEKLDDEISSASFNNELSPFRDSIISAEDYSKLISMKETQLEHLAREFDLDFYWALDTGGMYAPNRYDHDMVYMLAKTIDDIRGGDVKYWCRDKGYYDQPGVRRKNMKKFGALPIMKGKGKSFRRIGTKEGLIFYVGLQGDNLSRYSYILFRINRLLSGKFSEAKGEYPISKRVL